MLKLAALLVVAGLLAIAPARAQTGALTVYDGITGGQMLGIMESSGITAILDVDQFGDPIIAGTVNGYPFILEFYQCEGEDEARVCGELLFRIAFDFQEPLPADVIAEWNRSKVYGQAYLDEQGDPNLALWIAVDGGATAELLCYEVGRWSDAVNLFADFIGFDPGAGV